MGLGYCPTEFVHTNAMLVLNRNRYDYKFSDKNNTEFSLGFFYAFLKIFLMSHGNVYITKSTPAMITGKPMR